MGKSSKPTIGYWHKLTLYSGHMHGPADALRAWEWGGELAWSGNQTVSGDIAIDKPELFGGEKKEGGIRGTLSVRMGEPTQLPHPLLQAMRPGPWPAARGLVTTVYDGDVGALSPYVKNFRSKWSRWVMGWGTPVWQQALCQIGEGCNPAHILYQVATNPDWGMGLPASNIDEATFLPAAQTLFDEGFGLCLWWTRSETIGAFMDLVCEHVGAMWSIYDDKIELRLFRGGYDVQTLPLLDESNITELQEWDQPLLDGSINEVTVVGVEAETGKEISRTHQNLANVQAQGRIVSVKKQLPGLWNADLIARVAARECMAQSMLPFRVKVKVKGSAGPFKRGQVWALSWSRKGVVRAPVRIMEVDEGTATDSRCLLTLLLDVNGMVQTSYIAPDGSGWTPPVTTPVALNPEAVYEATYRDLVSTMRPADLALVSDAAGHLVSVGARPPVTAYNYRLFTRIAPAAFAEAATGDFSPQGQLAAAIPATDANTAIALLNHRDLDLVRMGEEAIVGAEHCRVVAIDAVAGTATLARGCVDTTPAAHAAGAQVWFPDTWHGYDHTEYLDSEIVDAKLLTYTASGTLAEAAATTRSVTMDSRQARPYAPGRLRISDTAGTVSAVYPAEAYGTLTADWSHRDRLLQADQLIDSAQTSIGPEPGTTYTARWYLDNVLVRTQAGLAGTSDSYTPPVGSGGKPVRIEIESMRDGLASRQRLQHTVLYRAQLVTESGDRIVTEAGDPIILE